jgi:cation transport regulator ChaC
MQRDGDRWVFGYGSLMWRPGFAFEEKRIATIHGYHRSLCVYSHVHRGTAEAPGLVLGLDRGGSCQGVAFRVRDENWNEVIDYLREREQVTSIYLEILLKAKLATAGIINMPAGWSAKTCCGWCARARACRATTRPISSIPTIICVASVSTTRR